MKAGILYKGAPALIAIFLCGVTAFFASGREAIPLPRTFCREHLSSYTSRGGAPQYLKYGNARFGYFIDYPSSFIKGEAPVNNDGRTFTSPDGSAQLSVYGSNNVLNETPESLYKSLLNETKGPIAYKVLRKNWFVVSWKKNGKITYQKSFVGRGSVNTFIFAYPKTQARHFASITAHLEASFIPGDLSETH